MQGIRIPIGGDTAGIHAAAAEVLAVFRQLAMEMQKSLAPARALSRDMRGSMQATASGTRQAVGTLKGMVNAASNVGFAIHNIASGAKGIRSAFRFLSSLPDGWRRVAKAAMVAGAAMLGVVVAVKVVRAALRGLLNVASGVWGGLRSGAASAARSIKGVFSGITSAIPGGGMMGPIAGIAGAAGAVALLFTSIKSGLGLAGELERTGIALEALTGSSANAKTVLNEMRATWLRTGVTIEDQAGTIQKFLALGFTQGDAMQLQKNILDVAGAVGMTTSEAALLGSALAQVKAKGVVSMEELRQQIAEKGVPVIEALATKLGVTQAALIDMVEEGKVPAQTLIDLFLNMEGSFGKFIGGSTRMGMSFLGMLARLRGAWNLMLADFAAPIADSLKPLISSAIGMVDRFRAQAAAAGKVVGDALIAGFALVRSGKTFELMKAGFAFAITGAMDIMMRGLRGAIAFLATALPPIFEVAMAKIRDPRFWEGIGVFLRGAAAGFAAEIRSAMGQTDLAESLRRQAGLDQALGSQLVGMAGNGEDIGSVISDALLEGGAAAAEAMGGPASQAFKNASDGLKTLLGTVKEEVAKLKAKTAIPPANQGTPASGTPNKEQEKAKAGSLMTLATSMARVGGGGFGMTFSPMITEQRKGNSLLASIERNTRHAGRAPVLV
jgi:tape measure domain-containing protein